jgi:hypothetical protein
MTEPLFEEAIDLFLQQNLPQAAIPASQRLLGLAIRVKSPNIPQLCQPKCRIVVE